MKQKSKCLNSSVHKHIVSFLLHFRTMLIIWKMKWSTKSEKKSDKWKRREHNQPPTSWPTSAICTRYYKLVRFVLCIASSLATIFDSHDLIGDDNTFGYLYWQFLKHHSGNSYMNSNDIHGAVTLCTAVPMYLIINFIYFNFRLKRKICPTRCVVAPAIYDSMSLKTTEHTDINLIYISCSNIHFMCTNKYIFCSNGAG